LNESAPLVSVVIPCRNEAAYIGQCLTSIIENDYPHERLEILVVDGMSDDGTREIVNKYHEAYPFIQLIDNPERITPVALNTAINASHGEIIMRVDAHSWCDREYIARCVAAIVDGAADNVGGIWQIVPRHDSLVARAIVQALTHPFGVGNADYRLVSGGEPRYVDTVPYFCCRREVFEKIGLFNENLARGQDMEFNRRLVESGGRILLLPNVVSYYHARTSPGEFIKHNWANGVWSILPFSYSSVTPVSVRHLVPLMFVASLGGATLLSRAVPPAAWLARLIAVTYGAANAAASISVAVRGRDPRYVLVMPVVFGVLHGAYGLGAAWGVARLAWAKRRRGSALTAPGTAHARRARA